MNNDIPPNYIFCARGGLGDDHSGNKYYRDMVAANQHRYQGTDADKRNLVQEIFDTLRNKGYHFMERNRQTGEYTQVDDDRVLKNKIPKCFRDTIQAANANSQHVNASSSSDDDHLSNVSSSFEHPHQSNERPFDGFVFRDDLSFSLGGSSSADGSVLSDSGSSLATFPPTFPEAEQQLNDINFAEFSFESTWEPTRSAAVTMQRPDVVKETIDALSRMNVREKDVSSKPDFANE